MPGEMEKARLDLERFEAQRAYEQQVALEGIRMRAEVDAGFGQQRALWQTIERGSDGSVDVVNISWRPEEGEVVLGDEVLEVANKEFEEWAAAGYRECVDGLGWDRQEKNKPKKEVRKEDWNVELRNERGRRTVRKVETEKERRDRQIELMVAQGLSMEWMEERRARREETIRNWRVWDELELAYEIAEAEREERDRSEESE